MVGQWTNNFPYSRFKWLSQKEINKLLLNLIGCNFTEENGSDGYMLEVDLEYSDKLQELHNDYPLAPEKLGISHNIMSKYCSNIANKYGINIGGVDKLVPNLGNKSKCVLHYRNFQFYLSLRIKLVNVHRALKFKQSDWLKKYIDFNATKMPPIILKKTLKLINNSTFGKTMENLRKRMNVRLVKNAGDYKKICKQTKFYFTEKIL